MAKFNFGAGHDKSTLKAKVETDTSSKSKFNFGERHDEAEVAVAIKERGTSSAVKGKSDASADNPWTSGMFYVLSVVIIIGLVAFMLKQISVQLLLVAIVAGVLVFGIAVTFDLLNRRRVSEDTFLKILRDLIKGLFKLQRLPRN
jgi:hypothetical protein